MSLGSRVPVQPDRRTGQQKAMVPRSCSIWKLTRSDSCPASELLSSEMGLAHFLSTPPAPSLHPFSSLFLPIHLLLFFLKKKMFLEDIHTPEV